MIESLLERLIAYIASYLPHINWQVTSMKLPKKFVLTYNYGEWEDKFLLCFIIALIAFVTYKFTKWFLKDAEYYYGELDRIDLFFLHALCLGAVYIAMGMQGYTFKEFMWTVMRMVYLYPVCYFTGWLVDFHCLDKYGGLRGNWLYYSVLIGACMIPFAFFLGAFGTHVWLPIPYRSIGENLQLIVVFFFIGLTMMSVCEWLDWLPPAYPLNTMVLAAFFMGFIIGERGAGPLTPDGSTLYILFLETVFSSTGMLIQLLIFVIAMIKPRDSRKW